MKSIWTSTFSFSAHSLTAFSVALLAPGTQWSQKPTEILPAAYAPRTNGGATRAVDTAAARATKRRRLTFLERMQFLLIATLRLAVVIVSPPPPFRTC